MSFSFYATMRKRYTPSFFRPSNTPAASTVPEADRRRDGAGSIIKTASSACKETQGENRHHHQLGLRDHRRPDAGIRQRHAHGLQRRPRRTPGGTAAPVFDTLSDEVENDARALSDLARLYVVKPSPETLTQYQQLQQTDKSIEQRLAGLKDNGASREELALLRDGLQIAAELQNEQQAARRMSPTAMRQRPSPCCTAMHTRPSWNVCRRRSIASARCSKIAPPSPLTVPPIARGSGAPCRKSWSA